MTRTKGIASNRERNHECVADFRPAHANIAAAFVQVAAGCPQAIAARQKGRPPLTYRELDRRSAGVAARLAEAGIGRGDFVTLFAVRSIDTLVALLGIVRCGAAYVPLDPAYPDVQLADMLLQAAPRLIIAEADVRSRIADCLPREQRFGAARVWDLADVCSRSEAGDTTPPGVAIGPEDPLYAMFTSGSTGRAKGVVVPHRAVRRLVIGQDYCELSRDEVVLHLAPLNFDASTFEIWGALLNGGTLAIVPQEKPSTAQIAETLGNARVTTAWLTAGLFHLMVDEHLEAIAGLRQLLAGGDVLSPDHVRRFMAAAPGCRLINGYGPTENTTFTCCATVTPGAWPCASVPIGKAIAGTEVHIVDDELRPVASGSPGQLVAAGDGLAIGYLGNPELTREKFVEAPAPIGKRVYLTGDLVRSLNEGTIEFLGRIDRQVKIDGKRVEPGEIEQALRDCAGVTDAAVALDRSPTGSHRIVAFVVAGQSSPTPIARIEAEAQQRLPAHMRPSRIVSVDALPMTLNGKIDRDALLALERRTPRGLASPASPVETTIAELWQQVLCVEAVGIDEPFFQLGGRSLQLMRIHAGLERTFGRKIDVAEMFSRPTVRELAQLIEAPMAERSAADEARLRADKRRAAMARRAGLPARVMAR